MWTVTALLTWASISWKLIMTRWRSQIFRARANLQAEPWKFCVLDASTKQNWLVVELQVSIVYYSSEIKRTQKPHYTAHVQLSILNVDQPQGFQHLKVPACVTWGLNSPAINVIRVVNHGDSLGSRNIWNLGSVLRMIDGTSGGYLIQPLRQTMP